MTARSSSALLAASVAKYAVKGGGSGDENVFVGIADEIAMEYTFNVELYPSTRQGIDSGLNSASLGKTLGPFELKTSLAADGEAAIAAGLTIYSRVPRPSVCDSLCLLRASSLAFC